MLCMGSHHCLEVQGKQGQVDGLQQQLGVLEGRCTEYADSIASLSAGHQQAAAAAATELQVGKSKKA